MFIEVIKYYVTTWRRISWAENRYYCFLTVPAYYICTVLKTGTTPVAFCEGITRPLFLFYSFLEVKDSVILLY
jgi:hypothetical protein